jgi:L-2-hydroxyglutarate oxidase LhgO
MLVLVVWLLAESAGASAGPSAWQIGQWVFNFIVTVSLAYVAAKNRKIEQLEATLKEATDRQIEDRFRAMSRELTLHLEPLLKEIDKICERLNAGDQDFRRLMDGDRQVEIKLLKEIAAVREQMLTRTDLQRLREELKRDG